MISSELRDLRPRTCSGSKEIRFNARQFNLTEAIAAKNPSNTSTLPEATRSRHSTTVSNHPGAMHWCTGLDEHWPLTPPRTLRCLTVCRRGRRQIPLSRRSTKCQTSVEK